jgi:hypothetical protein
MRLDFLELSYFKKYYIYILRTYDLAIAKISGNVVAAATKRSLKKHARHSFSDGLGEIMPPASQI